MTTPTPPHLRAAAVLAGWIDTRLTIPPDEKILDIEDLDAALCASAHHANNGVTSSAGWTAPWAHGWDGRTHRSQLSMARSAQDRCISARVDDAELVVRLRTNTSGLIPFRFEATVAADARLNCAFPDPPCDRIFPDIGRLLGEAPLFPQVVHALCDALGEERILSSLAPLGQSFICSLYVARYETLLGKNPMAPGYPAPDSEEERRRLEAELEAWRKRLTALSIPKLAAAKATPRRG